MKKPVSRVLWPSILLLPAAILSGIPASSRQPDERRVDLTITEGTSMAAAVSPDGRRLVIDLQGSLWTLPATGGRATRIFDEFYDARQPAWSPDGEAIVFQSPIGAAPGTSGRFGRMEPALGS